MSSTTSNTMHTDNRLRAFRMAGVVLLVLVLGSAATMAGTEGRWLHVRVEEDGHRGEQVNINVPLDMIAAFLPMIQTNDINNGKIRIDSHFDDADLHGIDLRELVAALRDAPDADFVTVRSDNENVRVSKEGGFIKINVDDRHDEKVRVTIPMSVIDALLGDDPNTLDLMAAINALADYDGGDLVTVESDTERVRIWIDGNQDQ